MINANTYLDLTSNYLKMLCSEKNADGSVTYRFAATPETLSVYAKKLCRVRAMSRGLRSILLQGTMQDRYRRACDIPQHSACLYSDAAGTVRDVSDDV